MNIKLDETTPALKPKGSLFKEFQKSEQVEILTQFKGLQSDPMIYKYKFYWSVDFKHWIITNAMAVPMGKLNAFKASNNEVKIGT